MTAAMNEAVVEEAALGWLAELGWAVRYGPDLGAAEETPERTGYDDPVLRGRVEAALERLNPGAPPAALVEARRRLETEGQGALLAVNKAVAALLTDGIAVDVMVDGEPRGFRVTVIDFDEPGNNDFVAVNQFTVIEGATERRPDIVCFVNGWPVAVIELKDVGNPEADVWAAWNQLQTYRTDLPRFFRTNVLMVASDGIEARMGAIGTPRERFAAWKTVDGDELAASRELQLEVLVRGVFEPGRFLDLMRSFVVFERDPYTEQIVKKIAQYHQYHAVRKAVESAVAASRATGDGKGKGGVVWHTQGSGKSLTMLFFAGKLVQAPAMANPTIVMLTDRNDLDDQLFDQFARGEHLLAQSPEQADSREELREWLRSRASGGVIFTTLQKFAPERKGERYPLLSERSNIVVMADEAHRGQYDLLDGFAAHMRSALPNATFVGFTGTPLELDDKDTRLVFGDYIDIYDIERAVEDGATVPIHYESRLIPLELPADQAALLDEEFDEITEGNEEARTERAKSRWTQLEALVGAPKRLEQLATDLVEHFERRQAVQPGKGMVVCMSRRICVDLYNAIARLRPGWVTGDDTTGKLKVVMTGAASDEPGFQPHIRTKQGRRLIEGRFKDPADELQLVIVRDMWLTGFDVPPLHTMFLDKPMRGHGLMQTIARVNRVFRDKPGGLVVDYLGLANNLREALRTYSESGGRGHGVERADPGLPGDAELVAVLLEKLEICRDLFHGFDYQAFLTGSPSERLTVLPAAQEFVLLKEFREPGFRKRFEDQTLALLKAFKLAGATEEAQRVRYEVAFFEALRGSLGKSGGAGQHRAAAEIDFAVRQLVDSAIAPGGVVDIFTAAGLDKPDISILSEGFLDDVRQMEQKNLAVELLRKLLNDEIGSRTKTNVVEEQRFSARLKQSLLKYQNRSVETALVIEELLALARDLREAAHRGDHLGLSEDELAFYDALGGADMAAVMGDQHLLAIAREVASTVRANATIDWTIQESVRANMRRMVRRVLRRHGYPPDRQEDATGTVVRQAELLTAARAA